MEKVESSRFNPWVFAVGGVAALIGTAALVSLVGPQPLRFLSLKQSIPTVVISLGALALVAGSLIPRLWSKEAVDETFTYSPQEQEDTLESYLKRHHCHLTVDTVRRLAREGKQMVKEIQEDPAKVDPSLENVEAIMWYLLDLQIREGKGVYDSWTWKIKDGEGKLTAFFKRVERKERWCKELASGIWEWAWHDKEMSWAKEDRWARYDRISTHFKDRFTGSQWGIDYEQGLLPGGKRTLLFIELKEQEYGEKLLVIKAEAWGAYSWGHWFRHGIDYGKSLVRKALGKNSDGNTAKEHLRKNLEGLGYKHIYKAPQEERARLENDEGYDHTDIRDGSEIILDPK